MHLVGPVFPVRRNPCGKAVAALANKTTPNDDTTIFIKSGAQTHQVKLQDILYLEKDGNYITAHLKDRNILIRENMGDVLDLVPNDERSPELALVRNLEGQEQARFALEAKSRRRVYTRIIGIQPRTARGGCRKFCSSFAKCSLLLRRGCSRVIHPGTFRGRFPSVIIAHEADSWMEY